MSQPKSLCEVFQRQATENADRVALRTVGGGVAITWAEYNRRVRDIAAGLAALGVRRGDTVGLMLTNRTEFSLCDAAAMHLGAAPFSIYNTSAPEQITYILGNAENAVMFCDAVFVDRIRASGPEVQHIICVDGNQLGALSLKELEALGRPDFDFDATWRAVEPDDLLTLIYTSGTTGPPKGVEVTHAGMLAMLEAVRASMPSGPDDRIISYLPAAHLADRLFSHYQAVGSGACLSSLVDATQLLAGLQDVRPTLWLAVPRVWEKFKAAVESRLDEPGRAAVEVGLRKIRAEQAARVGDGPGPDDQLLADYAAVDEALFAPIRRQLGLDRVRVAVTGAAPSALEVLEFFAAIGLPICELWGMSEIGVATWARLGEERYGTVGRALPGYELRLLEDGELLARSPALMKGYRKDPDRTAEAIDADGWMHTGDVATIDHDGYVQIIDRKKELIINSGGKNMSPVNIESKIKSAGLLIGQAVAIGDRRSYNVALIVLDPDAAAAYAAEHSLPSAAPADLCEDPGVQAVVEAAVGKANSQLSRTEQIKKFRILPVDWLPAGDELTPTSKLKRKPIAAKYADVIDALYAEGG
ncbi:MAG: long-chain fatty acid--CoA ligase [Actinobacteria bacterium]|nr:long-chain fatty acid--CoA ligase [Actinomycetota bacterium]